MDRAAENSALFQAVYMHVVQVEPGKPSAHALVFHSQKQGKMTSYLGRGGWVIMILSGCVGCGEQVIQANLGVQEAFSIS